MLESLITTLGLTPMEAECYEAVLKLGVCPMSELTLALKRHPQVVYRLIEQLRIKGLVLVETRLHRRYVKAENPTMIELKEAARLKDIQQMIPSLLAIQHEPKEAKVHIERGMEATLNLRRRAYEQLSQKQTYDVLGPSLSYYSGMKESDIHTIEHLREKKKNQEAYVGSII